MAVFAAGSAGAAMSTSSAELIGFRAVMGVGAAFVMPATLGAIALLFPLRERAKAIAVWSASAGVGVVIGPVLGGALLEHFAWGSAFWINVPLIAVALAGIVALVPPIPGRRGGHVDLLGALLSAAGLAAAVDMIVEAPRRGWTSATSLVEAGTAAVLLAAFVLWELRAREPMIDVRIFARRGFAVATASLGVTFFALFGALFVFSQYLQLVHGYSPLTAGLGAMPFATAMAATSGTSNLLAARLGTRTSIALGLTVVAVALGALSLTTVGTAYAVLAVILAGVGAGMGMIMAPASVATMSAVAREKAGAVSSINSVVRELGGVLGIAVVGSLVAGSYRGRMAGTAGARDLTSAHLAAAHLPGGLGRTLVASADQAFTVAMDRGMLVCAAVALAGALAALLWLPSRRRVAEAAAPVHAAPAPASEAIPAAVPELVAA
jgi:EmrB/QacA subfamily drug resistance transporter